MPQLKIHSSPDLIEVFKTAKGCIYQSDAQGCYFIEFAGKMSSYQPRIFFKLKNIVDNINLDQKFYCTKNSSDCEIINDGCNNCYVLTLCELVAFKELLNGAKVMLELNSIIREKLYFQPA